LAPCRLAKGRGEHGLRPPLPIVVDAIFAWWQDKKARKEWAAGAEQRHAEHRLKVIEELSKDPADAGALELYLKQTPER
jgi:hypothetical protein